MAETEFDGNVSSVRTGGLAGGYKITIDLPETDLFAAAKLMAFYQQNVRVKIEIIE